MSVYAQLQQQAYEQELHKQAAIYEAQQTEALFEAAFNEHTAKLAAADPEYAAILYAEQEKMAFDQAYYQTLQKVAFDQAYNETLAAYGQV